MGALTFSNPSGELTSSKVTSGRLVMELVAVAAVVVVEVLWWCGGGGGRGGGGGDS